MLSKDIIELMKNSSVKFVLQDIDGKKLTIWNINDKKIIVVDSNLVKIKAGSNRRYDQIHLSLNDNKAKSIPLSETNYADYFICGIKISDIDESYIMCIKCSNYKSLFKKSNKKTDNISFTTTLSTKDSDIDSIFEEVKKGTQKIKITTSNKCEGHFVNLGNDKSKQFEVLRNYFSNIDDNETNQNGDSNMDKKPTTKEMIAEEIEAKGTKQLILTGAPGTGKTFSAKKYVEEYMKKQGDDYWNGIKLEKNYGFVQFHSSYSYTDFVEGLRPVMTDNEQVSFVRMDGVFKEFCRKVVKNGDENHNYFFIIDEINRADLSKVFGELMFGLEDDYRGKGNEFDTQYKNLPTYRFEKKDNGEKKAEPIENDVFAKGFYIPENVIIIGTMNDIDRSVEAFDFALRRRFRWINVKANDVMDNVLEGMNEKLGLSDVKLNELSERAKALNKAITEEGESLGLNEDYHIGPAYYKHYRADTKNEDYFTFYLEPILMEYVRGRKPDKINNFIGNCKRAFIDTKSQDGSEADGKVNDNG